MIADVIGFFVLLMMVGLFVLFAAPMALIVLWLHRKLDIDTKSRKTGRQE